MASILSRPQWVKQLTKFTPDLHHCRPVQEVLQEAACLRHPSLTSSSQTFSSSHSWRSASIAESWLLLWPTEFNWFLRASFSICSSSLSLVKVMKTMWYQWWFQDFLCLKKSGNQEKSIKLSCLNWWKICLLKLRILQNFKEILPEKTFENVIITLSNISQYWIQ